MEQIREYLKNPWRLRLHVLWLVCFSVCPCWVGGCGRSSGMMPPPFTSASISKQDYLCMTINLCAEQ